MSIEDVDTILDDSEEFWAIDVTDELVEAIRLAYLNGLQGAAAYIGELSGVQVGISFDLVDPKVLEFIDERAAAMVRHVNDGTKYYLRTMIHGGVEEGIPEQDLIDGILENLFQEGDFSEKRIRSICRFEIARAQSDGWLKQMKEVGLEHVRWVTIGAAACEVCRANEEMGPQPVGSMNFDNVFGEKCAGPPAHPNLCRCHLNAMPEEISRLGKDFGFYTGKSEVVEKGGPTSGFRGHKGVPGQKGGSAPRGGEGVLPSVFVEGYHKNFSDVPIKDREEKLRGLEQLPVLNKSMYVGSGNSHQCQDNSLSYEKTSGADVYVGYMLDYRDPNDVDITSHTWNVRNGRVVERTALGMTVKEWMDRGVEYRGLKVDPKLYGGYKYEKWFSKEFGKLARSTGRAR